MAETTDQKPESDYLRIDYRGDASAGVLHDIIDNQSKAVAHEMNRSDLNALLDKIKAAAEDDKTTIGQLRKLWRDFDKRFVALYHERVSLMWSRFSLWARIVPGARKTVEQRLAELESTIAAKTEKWIADGLLAGLPGGDTEGGRSVLRMRLMRDDLDCIAANGRLAMARDELATAEANAMIPPSLKNCERAIPTTGNVIADTILAQEVSPVGEPELSCVAQALRSAVGLGGAPLLSAHASLLDSIQVAMGISPNGDGTNPARFHQLTAKVATRVADLLEQMPQTAPCKLAIQHCRENNRDERHFGGSKKTTYIDRETNKLATCN